MQSLFIRLTLMVALLIAPVGAEAVDVPWKAGLASVVITPEEPIPMAGYAARTQPFTAVEQDLHAKALALEDQNGLRAVLVTMDLSGIGRLVAEPVCNRIRKETGLARNQILLNASHTHAGPLLMRDLDAGFKTDTEENRRVTAYTHWLQNRLVEVVRQAIARLEPARLSWGSGVALFAMNRRLPTAQGIVLTENPRGLVDRTVPVLRVNSEEGRLRAVVFGYACHNTTLTGANLRLCGDYAGFAQADLEKRHEGVQAMFMMGCGGDANPYPRGTMALARDHGKALADEVSRVLTGGGPLREMRGPLRCAYGLASLPLKRFTRRQLETLIKTGPPWNVANARAMLDKWQDGIEPSPAYEAPVAVWRFGENLTLVALSGEVVVDYVSLVERALGPGGLWIAGYCNDVFGYFPSARVLAEGGYECRGLYTTQGFFAPEAEAALLDKVRTLAASIGHQLPAEMGSRR
jgi:Neutral/alkaline non-lysosomal ceramidase, N-terminal